VPQVPQKFDVVVVGAGPAGSSAAYLLAKAGFNVLVIERGRGAGSKELFGGKIYAAPLREIWPELDKEAPIHRWVTRERMSLVAGDRIARVQAGEEGGVHHLPDGDGEVDGLEGRGGRSHPSGRGQG